MSTVYWIGQTLGERYRIEERLGQGGMSSVYKASDPNLRRVVAIKMIHEHLSNNPEFVRRFEEEAAAVAQLRHDNIVQVYDFNHQEDVYYMVLEYIPGETLQERLRRLSAQGRRLDLAETLEYLAQICDAVHYAHQRGMIHRDIKPANVMLDVRGRAILTDFGIARILGGQMHTATGAVVGTALYMSPEQVRGDRADERSDIYSLGVTLYEAVSGKPPFVADSAMSVMMMHLHDPVPDIRTLQPQVPDALFAVISRALEKQREARFQTAGEMAAALRAVLAQQNRATTPAFGGALNQAMIFPPALTPHAPTPPPISGGPVYATPAANMPAANNPAAPPGYPAPAVSPYAYPPQAVDPHSGYPAPGGVTPPAAGVYPTPPGGYTAGGYPPGAYQTPPGGHPAGPAATDPLRSPAVIGAGVLALIALVALFVALQVVLDNNRSAPAPTPGASVMGAATQAEATATPELATLAPTMAVLVGQPPPTRPPVELPTETPAPPTATSTPPEPTATLPDRPFVRIDSIHLVDGRYAVAFTTFSYVPKSPGLHVHFYFNTVTPENAGVPGNGPWKMYSRSEVFTEYTPADRPGPATQLCAIVTNADHTVQPDSGTCFELPDV